MSRNGDGDLVVDHAHHLLGRHAVGRERRDQRARARADVDVELVDRAVDRQQVERPQRADLVDRAREAAAAEHERRLGAGRAAARLAARGGGARGALARAALELHDLAHLPPETSSARRRLPGRDFRAVRGFRTLDDAFHGPDRHARLPARRPRARRRLGGVAVRDGPRAGGADACRRPQLRRGGGRPRHRPADLLRAGGTPRMPASVQKLYTSATALRRFGASGRLTTTVLATAPPDAGGVVRGDLVPEGRRRPDVRHPRLQPARPAGRRRGDRRGHGPGDRRRVDVRRAPRRAVVRVPAHAPTSGRSPP